MKKDKKKKSVKNFVDTLRKQADKKNQFDCAVILEELNEASLNGEYIKYVQIKVNQATYFKKLGLTVNEVTNKSGFYEISWKDEK